MAIPGNKTCNECGETKVASDFYRFTHKGRPYLAPRCKKCRCKYLREWRGRPRVERVPYRIPEKKCCTKCGIIKTAAEFTQFFRKGVAYLLPRCTACKREYHKEWSKRPASRVKLTANHKSFRVALRAETLAAYGDKCVCCGEIEERFLTLDHKNNDGAAHRKSLASPSGKRYGNALGVNFYALLKREGWPDYIQLLCWNCNLGKRMNGGVCPHETAIDAIHLVGACG